MFGQRWSSTRPRLEFPPRPEARQGNRRGAIARHEGTFRRRSHRRTKEGRAPDLLMIVRADRYDWRSLDTAPVDEDVTLLVSEGRVHSAFFVVRIPLAGALDQ
jgi:hypothetical protein